MKTKDTPNRRTMNLEELATSLGIGRSLVYDLARRGELPVPVLKLGGNSSPALGGRATARR